ncbi:MAG: nitroreductase family protein [Bacteroidetes bacterium]|nr:nitroreductase family protein [Bacteroidota bacterium]MDA1336298.1 nitroreductase family protein [Bacteroidota bacterium]
MVKVKVFDSTEAKSRERVLDPAPEVDSKSFYDIVESRRSVRIYTDDPVPEEAIHRMMDAALKSPNSSNLQVWEIHWVRSAEKREKLIHYCLGQPAASTAQELFVFVARPDRWRQNNNRMISHLKSTPGTPEKAYQYFEKITRIVYNQGPLGIFRPFKWIWFTIRGWTKPTPREPIHRGHMNVWAHKSTALACQTFMLAARAEGFDSCPMEGLDSSKVKKLLGLPRSAGITMAISIGKRAQGGVYGPRFRFPKEDFIHQH